MDAFTFPSVDVLFHLEVKVGATQVGSCSKEFEGILLHLQDIKDSGDCESFPLSYYGNTEQRMVPALGSMERDSHCI